VAAVLQVEGHPVSDGLAEQEAGAVAVIVFPKALPIIENPHHIIG
jgi:hypothetical protein